MWLHTIFELSMVIGLGVAVYEMRGMRAHIKEMHDKVCSDEHDDNDVHLGV